MKSEYFRLYCQALDRDFEIKMYGHAGVPCIVFPAQDGRFYDFENFGMIDASKDFIDEGRVQFFCIDSVDGETFSDDGKEPKERMLLYEKYIDFVEKEVSPFILEQNAAEQKKRTEIMTCGCSMGAYHALLLLCHNPKLFSQVLGMSGIYNASYFMGEQEGDLFINNSPYDLINSSDCNSELAQELRKGKIALCCGQGAWEHDMGISLNQMREVLQEKAIPAWIDLWGYDVSHDWYWWQKQIDYFLQFMV